MKETFAEASRIRESGDIKAARKILIELSDKDRTSPAIFAVLGDVCWDLGLLDEAVVAFRRAVELAPTLEAASLGLFHCLWKLEKREEAMEELQRFQSISDSKDYREIVNEINEKWD